MKILPIAISLVLSLAATASRAADGVITVKSPYSAKETMDRFEGCALNP